MRTKKEEGGEKERQSKTDSQIANLREGVHINGDFYYSWLILKDFKKCAINCLGRKSYKLGVDLLLDIELLVHV